MQETPSNPLKTSQRESELESSILLHSKTQMITKTEQCHKVRKLEQIGVKSHNLTGITQGSPLLEIESSLSNDSAYQVSIYPTLLHKYHQVGDWETISLGLPWYLVTHNTDIRKRLMRINPLFISNPPNDADMACALHQN